MSGIEVAVNPPLWSRADIVHSHTLGPYAILSLVAGRHRKVVSAHITPESLIGSLAGANRLKSAASAYLTWAYNRADLILAVSLSARRELEEMGVATPILVHPGCPPARINSDATPTAEIRSHLGIEEDALVVASVGQIQHRKGFVEFIETAGAMPDVRFVWVGDILFGPLSHDRSALRRAARRAPANVHLPGTMSRVEVFSLLRASDAYLSLSKHETFGLATLEAATLGLPLLLSPLPVFEETYGEAAQYVTTQTAPRAIEELRARGVHNLWAGRAVAAAKMISGGLFISCVEE